MPYADMLEPAELANFSARYREACAGAVKTGLINLLGIHIGHGTYVMCGAVAEKCGARRTLLVLQSQDADTAMEQLDRGHYAATAVERKKGSMSNACRQASDYKGSKPVLFLATPRQVAEAGHWCEAWRDRKPFDLVVILDADRLANLRSEQGRGLETVARRAGTAVLVYNMDGARPDDVRRVVENWDTKPCVVDIPAVPGD